MKTLAQIEKSALANVKKAIKDVSKESEEEEEEEEDDDDRKEPLKLEEFINYKDE